jgi:hypothetical protein
VTPKHKRGRPPSLPAEYLLDLVNLLHHYDSQLRSLPAICRHIIKNGGVQWENSSGAVVASIVDARILRTRLIEARNWYLGLKRALDTVKHPLAAEFTLPLKFGVTIERRRKLKLATLGLSPKRTTRLRIGKKYMHSGAQKVAQ